MIDINQWQATIGMFSGSINNKQVKSICDSTSTDEVFCDRQELPAQHVAPMWFVSIYFGLNVFVCFFKSGLLCLAVT